MNFKPISRFLKPSLIAGFLLVLFAGVVKVHASFPGTNGKIAYTGTVAGITQVFVMNPDGTNQTQLTNSPIGNDSPSWSVDGTKIIFHSFRDSDSEIYVMNANGSVQTRLTNSPGGDDQPSWSPDGTKIAFYSDRDGDGEIFVMNADGTNETQLTNNTDYDVSPEWSPDGIKIAFDHNHEIWVMNADGNNQTLLVNSPGDDDQPHWSPDGTKIAFTSTRDGFYDIYMMDANGANQTSLTNDPSYDVQPAWSPDGDKIAFMTGRDGDAEIFVMNADGSNQSNLTNNSSNDVQPDWQPLHYNFSGFFQPVDNLPVFNSVKAGQGIPVKFSLNGDQGLDIFAADYPISQQIDCDTSAAVDGIELTLTAGSSSLSYDPVTDTYTYVWKSDKAWINTCRQLVVKLNDGTSHLANFSFK